MAQLFVPLTLRGMTVKHRVWVSPSGSSGSPSHRRRHGQGRISPQDAGIWNDDQAGWWERVTSFVHSQGAASGIQLAHAGRKASTRAPWPGRGPVDPVDGGWQAVAPSPLGYADWPTPKELTTQDIAVVVHVFADAAARADRAGFDVAELHAEHGYLLHQFLSPLTNHRAGRFGGDLAGRSRLLPDVADAVRAVWPDHKPLFVRGVGNRLGAGWLGRR